jgi:hypothetical protein
LMALVELVIGNLEAFFSNKPLLSPVILDEWTKQSFCLQQLVNLSWINSSI